MCEVMKEIFKYIYTQSISRGKEHTLNGNDLKPKVITEITVN